MAKLTIILPVIALIAQFLYQRWHPLSLIITNRPSALQTIQTLQSYEIKFADQVRNCEDVLLDEVQGTAILSCDPSRDRYNTVMDVFKPLSPEEAENAPPQHGALWIYEYTTSAPPRQLELKNFNITTFHPLGIELDTATSTLYVVNHDPSGSVIEIFTLSTDAKTATHIRTLSHPLIHTPNSITTLGDGKILFTNDHYIPSRQSAILSQAETWLGVPGGSVVYLDTTNIEATIKTVARIPFANGIVQLNKTTVAVASTSNAAINLYELSDTYDLTFTTSIPVPTLVDNLSLDGNGKLLFAGHPFAFALTRLAKRRYRCKPWNLTGEEVDKEACRCDGPSLFGEWSDERGVRVLYSGMGFCSSTTAVRDVERGVGFVSGLYEWGFLVFRV